MGRCHIGLGPCFINENQSISTDRFLILLPPIAAVGNIRPVLFNAVAPCAEPNTVSEECFF